MEKKKKRKEKRTMENLSLPPLFVFLIIKTVRKRRNKNGRPSF
jgi:hypothetical protein